MQRRAWTGRLLGGASFVLSAVGLGLLVYGLLMFVVQRRIAFPGAMRDSPRATPTAPAGARQVWLETSFGRVEAWLYAAAGAHAPTVIFAHGNGELIEDWQGPMETLRAAGVSALLVEFPGYGHSEGEPKRETIREAFAAAFDWLVAEGGVDPERIVAYGRSIGGGAAGDLARERPVRALALQSTFSSAAEIARELFLPGFLVLDRFDNRRAVRDFEGPVLLMHGRTDEVIGFAHAERLARARPGLAITEIACGHNDCGRVWPEIVQALTGFLRAHGLMGERSPAPGE
jgi:pimeloyl-ACP methyl ester carboxylesterase